MATNKQKMDWSLAEAGKWSMKKCGGTFPTGGLKSFSAAYFGGKVYVVAGEYPHVAMDFTPRAKRINNDVYALDVDTMRWSIVKHKGDRVASGPIGFSTVWKERYLVTVSVVGKAPVLNLFDMKDASWSCKKTDWPKSLKYKPSFFSDTSREESASAAIWEDKLYVTGGRSEPAYLHCLDLLTLKWEVAYHEPEISYSCPEGRHCHSMWAAKGKVYIFGGRGWTGQEVDPLDYDKRMEEEDVMMYERCYFWSFDITTKTWTNEACYTQSQGLGFISNMPSPRSEAPVTQFGGGRYTLVHGGYSTLVPHYQPPYMIRCSYLSDTFLYDTETKRWKIISTDNFPQHRGGHAIVYVPPSEPSDRKGKLMGGGKALLFGGYKGGATTELLPFSEVWELTLQSSLKQVSATCHCCGKFFGPGGGLKKCTGTCDGAVVLCSEECRQKNWEVHKLWCRKKRDMVATPSEQTEE